MVRGRGGKFYLAGREKFTYHIPGMNPYFILLLQQRKVMDRVVSFEQTKEKKNSTLSGVIPGMRIVTKLTYFLGNSG